MPKKMFSVFAFALAALASGVFAQVSIDVILRDFDVSAHGFEMFDGNQERNGVCGGSWTGGRNTQTTDENAICFTNSGEYGYCKDLKFSTCTGDVKNGNCANHLAYGESSGSVKRGYCNGPDRRSGFNCDVWGNYIYVTRGLVQKNLRYDKENCPSELIIEAPQGEPELPDFLKYRYCAYPQKGNGECNSRDIENWFRDGEHTRTFRDTIIFRDTVISQNEYIYINYDGNTSRDWSGNGSRGADNGYFPLDKYEGENDIYGRRIYGMQSFNAWCPNKDSGTSNGINCGTWYDKGGPKDGSAAKNTNSNSNRLHNYGFSMMGSASFRYDGNSTDVFEFIGDDDMWIFIDGELAADLGGVHLAAPAKLKIEELARDRGWEPGSMHAVNFFYMDRNTDGSNLRLQVKLNGMSSSIFVGPYIKEAKTTQNSDGSSNTVIYVNTKIDKQKIEEFINSGNFPIIITTSNPDDKDIRGFKLDSISNPEYLGSDKGYAYVIYGQVCKSPSDCGNLIINSGDSLSFNVLRDDIVGYNANGFALPNENWYIVADGTKRPANKIQWAPNSTTLPPIKFKPVPGDKNPWKPDFVDQWFSGDPNGGKDGGKGGGIDGAGFLEDPRGGGDFPKIRMIYDPREGKMVEIPKKNEDIHGFGSKGIAIPPNRAGELLLTAYPYAGGQVKTKNGTMSYADWEKDESIQKLFGLPPEPENGKFFGIADPTIPSDEGGFAFVKNGFPGESSVGGRIQIAPTRCISDRSDPDKPRINCLNFSLLAKQPFRIAVTVYDQLGNFVTQYREEVGEREFRSVVQGPTYVNGSGIGSMEPTSDCKKPSGGNIPSSGPGSYGDPQTMTVNGLIKVNVNIYPFSADGRRFGNGVYLLKVDRVDLPYEGCAASGANAVWIEEPFVRYHADEKFGWARSKAKDKAE